MTAGVAEPLIAFLDVVDSRALYRRLGDHVAHDRIVGALARLERDLTARGGEIIKRVGDAILCRFRDSAQGVAALGDVQRACDFNWRVGAHAGPVIDRDGDIFGDTVNRAARLAALARAREILLTEEVARSLPESLASRCRPVERVRLKGDDEAAVLYRFGWEGTHATVVNTAISITAAKTPGELRLETPAGTVWLLPGETYRIGRDSDCDLVFDDVRVSRLHATLEWRRGRCVLCDHSTNGSYVHGVEATRAVFLRREDMPLVGAGRIVFAGLASGLAVEFQYE